MVREKDLIHIRQIRFRDGDGVTFEHLENEFLEAAASFAIPAALGRDQIQSGGMLAKTVIDCMTLYHPEHAKDYNYYLFTITRQGTYAFVDVWSGGSSSIGAAQFAKQNLLNMGNLDAYSQGTVVGSLIRGAIGGGLFAGKRKQEAENNWYTMVNDIIEDILS